MNNLCGRRKSLSFRFHEIATQARNDKVFRLRPKRKPIRSVLINGLCIFENVTKPPTASLWSGLFDVHSFKGHLFTDCACSERTYSRYVQLRRRNTSRNGGEQISAELASHTSPFCNDYNKLQSFAFWSLCSFSHTPKTALSSLLLTPKFACF